MRSILTAASADSQRVHATRRAKKQAVKAKLQLQSLLDARNADGETALMLACRRG